MSNPQQIPQIPQIRTPTTKPLQPTIDPPTIALPPSFPKQSYLLHDLENEPNLDSSENPIATTARRGSTWGQDQPMARSLTNNDHSIIPGSLGNANAIKMGQSPTILSILSGTDQTHNATSYRGGSSMVASSRTYVSTNVPQQFSPQTNQNSFTSSHPQQQTIPHHYPQPIQPSCEEDEISEIDDISQDELPFDFTLEE